MRLYTRRFVTLHNEEAGGEGSAGGGGATIDLDQGTASAADAGQAQAAASQPNDAPKSMLEAIERGLKGDAAAAAEGGEADKPADERTRDEQGRFARKQEAEQAAEAAKKVAEEAAAKQKAGKPGDEIQMPEGLSEKAQERFRTLTHRLHETNARAERAEADLSEFRAVLKNTGGRPEDFAAAFDYIAAINRGDLQSALSMLDSQRRQLSLMMGKPLPGADPLAEFPDLRQRVEAYQMDEQAAIELARARRMQQIQAEQRQQTEHAQQQTQAQVTARSNAMAEVDRISAEWAARDPDYTRKEELILKQIPVIAQNFPPQMWPAQVRILYETLSSMPAPAPARAGAPAPLRPSGQQGGTRKPASMLEALNSGLGYGS